MFEGKIFEGCFLVWEMLYLLGREQLSPILKHTKMKSRIAIEVDFENSNLPIIQIVSQESEDVRDKLVKSFLQSLQHCSRWTTITFVGNNLSYKPDGGADSWTWKITPVTPDRLESEIQLMQAEFQRLQSMTKEELPVDPDA